MLALNKFARITCVRNVLQRFIRVPSSDRRFFSFSAEKKGRARDRMHRTFADRSLDSFANVIVTFAVVLPRSMNSFNGRIRADLSQHVFRKNATPV
jgi:hypothetical protein